MKWPVLLMALLGASCAVKGYDLGWRVDGPLTAAFGAPLDPVAGCRLRAGVTPERSACQSLGARLDGVLGDLPQSIEAAEAAGARCRDDRCSYADLYERRDVGTALIVPVLRRITLREARMSFVLGQRGWALETASVRDSAPPGYGPVRIGGAPPTN